MTTVPETNKTRLAECVGLWLAEGDTVTKAEITLTNNCSKIIVLFHSVISQLFSLTNNPRLYVYSPSRDMKPTLPIDVEYKHYIDERARKPYFIYRTAGVDLVKKWHKLVKSIKNNSRLFKDILSGFIAGEGSVRFEEKSKSRVVRISQGQENIFLERILNDFSIEYRYDKSSRYYEISNRKNLEKLKKLKVVDLHPDKKERFILMIKTYKERHYPKNFLKNKIIEFLNTPRTSKQLSKIFNRSQARITRVLSKLKKEGKVQNYRVKSKDYWIRSNTKTIIISSVKNEILMFLKEPKSTKEIAEYRKKTYKSTFNRLKELEKLKLIKRMSDEKWIKINTKKEVIII